jgi:sugar phosphate isomerase/epimerase
VRDQLALSMWSVHRHCAHEGWTGEHFLDFAHGLGARRVELLNYFVKVDPDDIYRMRDRAQALDLAVACWSVGNDFARPDFAAQVREIVRGVEVARVLGAPVVRVFAGDLKAGMDLAVFEGTVVRGLREAASAAESAGVTLALENHGLAAGRSEQIQRIIEAVGSPALGATVDVGNFVLADEDPLAAVERLLPYVRHVHLKDMAPSPDPTTGWQSLAGRRVVSVDAGQGTVPFRQIFERLRDSGYARSLSLEYEAAGDELDGTRASWAYLAGLLESVA